MTKEKQETSAVLFNSDFNLMASKISYLASIHNFLHFFVTSTVLGFDSVIVSLKRSVSVIRDWFATIVDP